MDCQPGDHMGLLKSFYQCFCEYVCVNIYTSPLRVAGQGKRLIDSTNKVQCINNSFFFMLAVAELDTYLSMSPDELLGVSFSPGGKYDMM